MKKTIIFLAIALLFGTFNVYSQAGKYFLGAKVGINEAYYNYSYSGYSNYSQDLNTEFLVGLTGEYFFTNFFSLKPDLLYIGRGVKMDNHDFKYDVNVKYFEINAPFTLTLRNVFTYEPYILAGPYLGFVVGGDIAYSDGIDYKTNVSTGNMFPLDLGYRLGVGLRKNLSLWKMVACVEFAYSAGLISTFSGDELDGKAFPLNQPGDYDIKGTRKNEGWELSLSLLIPLGREKDSKPAIVEKPAQKIHTEVVIPEKYCYTMEEILDYNRRGLSIINKKICVYDIKFETGKSIIVKDSKKYIDKIVGLMKELDYINVVVHGHTDAAGEENYNLNLSDARAKAVYQYMIDEGISAKRLSYKGHGENQPIDDNTTTEGKAKNRRVEFELVNF